MRVIPRDLFNEANLLKMFGQIYLILERLNIQDVELEHDGEAFAVDQNESTGGLFISNVQLSVRGSKPYIERPLNSREPWPLYLTTEEDGEEISVFDRGGDFTPEMLAYLQGA